MGALRLSVVLVVVVVMVGVAQCFPSRDQGYWEHWQGLQQQKREREGQGGAEAPPPRSRLAAAVYKRQQQKLQAERDEARMEALQDMLEDSNLEDVAMTVGLDVLAAIIMPHAPTTPAPGPFFGQAPPSPAPQPCVTKNINASIVIHEMMPPEHGQIVYTVCGSGDAASLHLRFSHPTETTPGVDPPTTTTTPPTPTPTPPAPPCPEHPDPEAQDEEETTTTAPPPTPTPEGIETTTVP